MTMTFETVVNEDSMNIAATILNRRAYKVTKKAHQITLDAIRQEMADGWEYVIGSLDGVPCVVGSYDRGGIAVDIACLPEYQDRYAVESMFGFIEGELARHGTRFMVVVADIDDPKEKHLATVLAKQGYIRSDSLGYPHPEGDFMSNRALEKAKLKILLSNLTSSRQR